MIFLLIPRRQRSRKASYEAVKRVGGGAWGGWGGGGGEMDGAAAVEPENGKSEEGEISRG
jgi:hypothetical protein